MYDKEEYNSRRAKNHRVLFASETTSYGNENFLASGAPLFGRKATPISRNDAPLNDATSENDLPCYAQRSSMCVTIIRPGNLTWFEIGIGENL